MTGPAAIRADGPRRRLLWCLVLAGASAGFLLAFSERAVRTEVSKLGAASSWEFGVRALGARVYRTRVVATTREEFQDRTQALARRWRWGLAAVFALAGAGAGIAVANAVPRLTRALRPTGPTARRFPCGPRSTA